MAGCFKIFAVSDEVSFDDFIRVPMFLFRIELFEFEPADESASVRQKLIRLAKQSFFKLLMFTFGIACISMIGYAVVNSCNFVAAASSVPNVVTLSLIALKALTTHAHKDDIWNIFQELTGLFERRANQNVKNNVRKYLDDYHRVVKVYGGIMIVIFIPIFASIFPFILHGTMKLPVNYWFPFDAYQPKTFPFVYTWLIWIAANCLTFLLAADTLFFCLVTIITMEFDILHDDLLEFNSNASHEKKEKLIELTERHNKLLDICDKLQDIYAVTFFFSFGISSLIMCFVAFQLSTATENLFEVYTFYVPYLGMIVGQVYLLCLYGQKLIDSSLSITDAAYNNHWEEDQDNDLKKQFILIMMRAQRAKRFTALNFADISLPSFTSVLTTTGSYFSLLKNVYTEN